MRLRRRPGDQGVLSPPDAIARRPWTASLALLGLTAAGAVLRLRNLGGESLWLDEAISATHARLPLGKLLGGVVDPGNPPLYYALLKAWTALFGSSEAGLRSLSALAGVAAIPLLFAVARALFRDERTGLAAAALGAFLPALVCYGQEARPFALLVLAGLAAAWALSRALATDAWGWWAGCAAAGALAFWLHYTGALVPIFLAAAVLALARRRRAFASLGLCAALCVPAAALWFAPSMGRYPFWQQGFGPGALLDLADTAFGRLLVHHPDARDTDLPLSFALALALALPPALAAWKAWRGEREEERRALLLGLAYLLAPLAAFAVIASIKPAWHSRYLLVALPGWCLLAAWALVSAPRIARLLVGALVVFLTIFGLATSGIHWRKSDWRSAAEAVGEAERAAGEGGRVLVTMGHEVEMLAYYDRGAWPREGYDQGSPVDCPRLFALADRPGPVVVVQADTVDGDPGLIVAHRIAQRLGPAQVRHPFGVRVMAFGVGRALPGFESVTAEQMALPENPCR